MSDAHNHDSFEDDYADDDFHEFSADADLDHLGGHDDGHQTDSGTTHDDANNAVKDVYNSEEGTGEAVELSVDPDTGVLNLGDPISIGPDTDSNLHGAGKRDEQLFAFRGEVLMDEEERKRQAIYKRSHAQQLHQDVDNKKQTHEDSYDSGDGDGHKESGGDTGDLSHMRYSLEHSYSNDKFDSPSPMLQKHREHAPLHSYTQSQSQTQQGIQSNHKYTGDAETKSNNTSINSPIQYRDNNHQKVSHKYTDSDRDLLPPDLLELLGDSGNDSPSLSTGQDMSHGDDASLNSRESEPRTGLRRQKKNGVSQLNHNGKSKNEKGGAAPYGYKYIRKELDIALKRLNMVEKEKQILLQNNDRNYLSKEVEKLKSILSQREKTIVSLKADKKGLESMMRNQSKKLQEMAYEAERMREFGSNSSLSNQKQFEVMMERIKRLNEHVKEYRDKGRDKDSLIKKQKKTIDKMKAHLIKVLREQKEKGAEAEDGENEGSVGQVPSIVQDSVFSSNTQPTQAQSVEGRSVDGPSSLYSETPGVPPKVGSHMGPGSDHPLVGNDGDGSQDDVGNNMDATVEAGLRRALLQLQKSMSIQKASHTREVLGLQNEVKKCQNTVYRLEAELDERERHSRSQVMMVARLRKSCEELEAGNSRLMVASDLYSRAVVAPHSKAEHEEEGEEEGGGGGESQGTRPPPVSFADGHNNVLNQLEYSIRGMNGPQRPQQGPMGGKRPVQRKYNSNNSR